MAFTKDFFEGDLARIILRLAVFIVLLTSIRFFLNTFFASSELYELLVIPGVFKPLSTGNLALAGLVAGIGFLLVNKERVKKLEVHGSFFYEKVVFGVAALLSVAVYYFLRFLVNENLVFSERFIWLVVPLLYLFIFLFPLFLLLSVFGSRFFRDAFALFRSQVFFVVVAWIIVYVVLVVVRSLWIYFSGGVARVLEFVFSLFFEDVLLIHRPGGPFLRVEGFGAFIGAPCSGVDSFFLFVGLMLFIFLLDYNKINKKSMLLLLVPGIIGMYFVNVFRVFLLYLVGIYVSPEFAVGLFHQNIGWLLFIAYFAVFWFVCSGFVYRK